MPFLNRLRTWARERPHDIAVAIGRRGLSWTELEERATGLVPDSSQTTVLCEPNSLDFVARFAAAVAGERRCAVLDPTWPDELREEIKARLEPLGQPSEGELVDGAPATTFLIGLTSGTTSVPKAFRRSRDSWRRSFEASIEFFDLRTNDRTLAPGPLAASLNLYALAECLFAGSEFHTLECFDIAEAHMAIQHDGITRLIVVPTMLRMLSERGLMSSVDASGIRTIICAGSKLDTRTLGAARRWAPNATIIEYYGASELSFVAGTKLAPGEPAAAADTAIGAPFPGVEISILDDARTEQPPGTPGNIFIRSQMVCDGYLWGDDQLALQHHNGMFTVGDRGFLLNDQLHILGRGSDMIITGGQNVYPHEVELALSCIPAVSAAVVVGVPDDMRGQRITAGIMPACGGLTAAALTAGLDGLLPPGKRPQQYVSLKSMPLSDRGKVSRKMLLEWLASDDDRIEHLP